jgi:predicted XRE-type DNA-binding protein
MSPDKPEYTVSSGNVFADLGLPQSEELLAKAALVHEIASIAKHRHMTQEETARTLGTTQPKVSDLFAGRLEGFSMERLIRFLNALDRDVDIVVSQKPKSRKSATLKVTGKSATWSAPSVRKHTGSNARQMAGGV